MCKPRLSPDIHRPTSDVAWAAGSWQRPFATPSGRGAGASTSTSTRSTALRSTSMRGPGSSASFGCKTITSSGAIRSENSCCRSSCCYAHSISQPQSHLRRQDEAQSKDEGNRNALLYCAAVQLARGPTASRDVFDVEAGQRPGAASGAQPAQASFLTWILQSISSQLPTLPSTFLARLFDRRQATAQSGLPGQARG